MAERGFLTLAVDPAYTGESGGWPRNVASPDICTEDYGAAVDFLSVQDNVDPERIGIIGICGYGGFALNAAIIDTRVKATVTSTMYDISRMNANGNIGEADSAEARDAIRERLSAQRTEDFRNGDYAHDGGVPKEVPDYFPDMVKNAVNYYTTDRGYHERSLNSNGGSTITYPLSFINAPLLTYLDELKSAVLLWTFPTAASMSGTAIFIRKKQWRLSIISRSRRKVGSRCFILSTLKRKWKQTQADGFGIGTDTVAEGWIGSALAFWETQ